MKTKLFFILIFIILILAEKTPAQGFESNINQKKSFQISQGDSNVTVIGRWAYGRNNATFVVGNYAYIGKKEAMDILDISNPDFPVCVGQILVPSEVYDVCVENNYAYLAADNAGLRIIDVSDPALPSEVGFYEMGSFSSAKGVFISGNYAYVAAFLGGLRIIDISDPASPIEVGFYDTKNFAKGIYVVGNYAYVADNADGLRIIDVSDPASPQEVGFYDTDGWAKDVFVLGDYAYVADNRNGLRIMDISNPASPQEVGFYDKGCRNEDESIFDFGPSGGDRRIC